MAEVDGGIISGGSGSEESEHEAGQLLAEECAAAGICVSFGTLSQDQILQWWDRQAESYSSAETFLQGYGLQNGGTVVLNYRTINGNIISADDGDNKDEFSFRYQAGDEIVLNTTGGPCRIAVDVSENLTVDVSVFDPDGALYDSDSIKKYVTGVAFHNDIVKLLYCNIYPSGNYFYAKLFFLAEWDAGWSPPYTHRVEYSNSTTKNIALPYSVEAELTSVTISYQTGGGGGGGGGGGPSSLKFIATAGLSGRFAYPGVSIAIRVPYERNEKPAYGCGGYGGHGGGGGAGASTVVIHKFTSGKANSVEQIAVAQRHGYGSGGGAGGMGGDGCILVFW